MRGLVWLVVVVLMVLSGWLTGCSSSAEFAKEALKSTAVAPGAVGDTGARTPTSTPRLLEYSAKPTATAVPSSVKPTPTSPPRPTAIPKPQPLKLAAKGFGQHEAHLGYAFVLENPNQALAFESSDYQVAAYDDAGKVLKTESGYVELLLPGQARVVAGEMYLDQEEVSVARLEVQIKPGHATSAQPQPTFETESVIYVPGEYQSQVKGLVNSPYKQDVTNLRVSAVAYDQSGAIIGGGYTYLDFIPAEGQAAVEVPVTVGAEPAKVELYPALTAMSIMTRGPSKQGQPPKLASKGFGQQERSFGYAFLVENPNAKLAIESSSYQVAAYDQAGNVLKTDSGYVDLLLPGQKLAVAGDSYLDQEGVQIARLDVQLRPGQFIAAEAQPGLSTANVTYTGIEAGSKVKGVVRSPYKTDVSHLRVSAVALDASGAIVGGGYSYLDFVPAEGQAAIEVSVTAASEPAKVELHPMLTSLSELAAAAEADGKQGLPLKLAAKGFGQNEARLGFGFVVENPNPDLAIEGSPYQVAAYDEAGNVLRAQSGYIGLLLPGQKLGVGDYTYLDEADEEDAKVARFDVQLRAGRFTPSGPQPTFTAQQVTYAEGDWDATVTGVVNSPYKKDVSSVRVYAVAYDDAGAIVGGGSGYLEFVPAEGQSAAEVSVVVGAKPARAELSATVGSLSDLSQ